MSKIAKVAAVVAMSLILLAASAAAGGLYGRFTQTNEARKNNKATWHKVICHIESETVKGRKQPYPKKVVRSLRFFDTVLVEDVNTTPCGIVQQEAQ